ncbi:hypothetical protein [Saccharothrix syringae]|uniref:Uncharacterized protein n=1 Tax=Saccharothrix syringae TaxID=103733 RepID=A0A5Q0GX79_SACSY|nr:hypothetical protein [Saccharothrix syringae]QFZ18541.1 hypothetical protein EKG83_14665 [Saccharothrix syringae]
MAKRKFALFASAAAVAALLTMTLSAPASASSSASDAPADRYAGGPATTAVDAEFNQAVAGTPPSGLPCVSTTGATACFEANGDKWWVRDTAADSASAEAFWENYRGGSLYRTGVCRNSLGNGKWGVCNKNYYEDSGLRWSACVYDASAGTLIRCSQWYP